MPIEAFLGRYGDGPRRDKIAPLYGAMYAEAMRLAAPAILYAEYRPDEVAELAAWLPGATKSVVLALCTLGPSLDDRITELSEGKTAWALVLDEIASALVGGMARNLHALVRRQAEPQGMKAGPAFRPGLGRWPLEAQRTVFDRLPAHQIGVSLNPSLVMTPIKSTSLIVPLRPIERGTEQPIRRRDERAGGDGRPNGD
jgi:hypothetical protein